MSIVSIICRWDRNSSDRFPRLEWATIKEPVEYAAGKVSVKVHPSMNVRQWHTATFIAKFSSWDKAVEAQSAIWGLTVGLNWLEDMGAISAVDAGMCCHYAVLKILTEKGMLCPGMEVH